MSLQIVTPANLGNTLKAAHITAGKYDVNIDKDTLLALADGTLAVNTNIGTGESDALKALIKGQETATSMSYDAATKIISYTNEKGTVSNINLSALAVDIYVDGASYDAATMVLKLIDNDTGTPDISVNLAELKKVSSQNSTTVTLSGTGEASSPLKADVNVSNAATNLLKTDANGLLVSKTDITDLASVDVQDAFGTHLFYAFP